MFSEATWQRDVSSLISEKDGFLNRSEKEYFSDRYSEATWQRDVSSLISEKDGFSNRSEKEYFSDRHMLR